MSDEAVIIKRTGTLYLGGPPLIDPPPDLDYFYRRKAWKPRDELLTRLHEEEMIHPTSNLVHDGVILPHETRQVYVPPPPPLPAHTRTATGRRMFTANHLRTTVCKVTYS